MGEQYFETGDGRLFLQRYGPRPDRAYEYYGCARAGGFTEPRGDKTAYYCPDPQRRGKYLVAGKTFGVPALPTTQIVARLSTLNLMRKLHCAFDLQALLGKCKDPQDRIRGWSKIFHFYLADLTQVASDGLTAMQPDDAAPILVTGDVAADAMFEIDPMNWSETVEADVTTQVMDVAICDYLSCGDCEDVSEGCEKVYLVCQAPGAGSPAIIPELVYTKNGGATWYNEYIDTLGATEQPIAVACVGDYVLVISDSAAQLHYALKGTEGTWTEVATGFVGTNYPRCISVVSASQIFIGGAGGYIYYSSDITSGVSVLDAGSATAQNLNKIHALNSSFVVAVGNANAVVYTENGGANWVSVTGPVPGNNLTALWVASEKVWFVGTDNIGKLYYTLDGGTTWTEKTYADSATGGDITDIVFSEDPAVGYFTFSSMAKVGRIYRTLDGGYSWYRVPESTGLTLPAVDYIKALAVCGVNEVWAGGLADDGADGTVLHGVGYE